MPSSVSAIVVCSFRNIYITAYAQSAEIYLTLKGNHAIIEPAKVLLLWHDFRERIDLPRQRLFSAFSFYRLKIFESICCAMPSRPCGILPDCIRCCMIACGLFAMLSGTAIPFCFKMFNACSRGLGCTGAPCAAILLYKSFGIAFTAFLFRVPVRCAQSRYAAFKFFACNEI